MIWTLLDVGTAAGLAALCLLGLVHAIVLIALLEYNKRIAGAVLTVITIGAIVALGNTWLPGWLLTHWMQTIAYVIGYLVAGPVVAYFKWFSRARHGAERWFQELTGYLHSLPGRIADYTQQINSEMKGRANYAEQCKSGRGQFQPRSYIMLDDEKIESMKAAIVAWDTAVKAKDLTPECKPYFEDYIADLERRTGKLCHCPDPDEPGSLGMWVGWASFWPWVCVWTLVNDPLRRIFTHVYFYMKGQLRKAAQYAWRDIMAKVKAVEESAKAKAAEEAAKAAKAAEVPKEVVADKAGNE